MNVTVDDAMVDQHELRKRVGAEFKRADATGMTPSMRIAVADLKLTEEGTLAAI
ncbi:MAG: hypothetical protein ABI580_10060 [Burkholderiaceae bacterium]